MAKLACNTFSLHVDWCMFQNTFSEQTLNKCIPYKIILLPHMHHCSAVDYPQYIVHGVAMIISAIKLIIKSLIVRSDWAPVHGGWYFMR